MPRNTIHAVAALVLWGVFAIYWRIVMRRPVNADTKIAVASLAILSIMTMIYLVFWVRHNIQIARKHGRRKVRRRGVRGPIQDYLGRWLVVDDPARLQSAKYIEVEIKSGVLNRRIVEEKVFRTPPPGPQ